MRQVYPQADWRTESIRRIAAARHAALMRAIDPTPPPTSRTATSLPRLLAYELIVGLVVALLLS